MERPHQMCLPDRRGPEIRRPGLAYFTEQFDACEIEDACEME